MIKVKTYYKKINKIVSPKDFFRVISNNGKKENCILFESADILKKTGEKSIGSTNPSLRIIGKENNFEIIALNENGKKLIKYFKNKFDFAQNLTLGKNKLSGSIKKINGEFSEEERMKLITLADVLRVIAFEFVPKKEFELSIGLFGAISYDFIDQFEKLPKNKSDLINDNDIDMFFLDNLFIIDHIKNTTTFYSNDLFNEKENCKKIISNYESYFKKIKNNKIKFKNKNNGKITNITSDTNKEEFESMVETAKKHIVAGDSFQIVLSRTKIIKAKLNDFDVYDQLSKINPGPYMFYYKSKEDTLLGSSPETFVKVFDTKNGKKVLTKPIAGTRKRGLNEDGSFDFDLDSRYENELKIDKKEIAEHTMLVDLSRNDIARISKPGTRYAEKLYYVDKYSHVMHIVSDITGMLKDNYDALNVYLACMNMGTMTGAPKIKSMEIIRNLEKNKRGFYAGSIGYITSHKNMDFAVTIRCIRIKKENLFIRVGAGIVFDSIASQEYFETENKAKASIRAIEESVKGEAK